MVKKKHYDLIFLDHLMPDLDGVGTLEKIRSDENMCNDTPVIAFTANAISGMKESFLATGFNGFISKPVDANKLEDMLFDFLPKEQIKEGKVILGSKTEEKLPDLEDFDFRYAKVCLGEAKLIKSVAADFYDQTSRIRDALESYVKNIDDAEAMSRYRTDVHALKSTSRMLGEITLSGLAKTSEDAAKAFDKDTVLTLHPMILKELEKAKAELYELLPKEESVEHKDVSKEVLIQKLEDLKNALDNRDVKGQDAIVKELSGFNYDENLLKKMNELFEYVKILKMLKANVLLEEILKDVRG